MKRNIKVQSSVIKEVTYDTNTYDMFITFHSGYRYVYHGVPESVFDAFLNADSHGVFFNTKIRDVYPLERLENVTETPEEDPEDQEQDLDEGDELSALIGSITGISPDKARACARVMMANIKAYTEKEHGMRSAEDVLSRSAARLGKLIQYRQALATKAATTDVSRELYETGIKIDLLKDIIMY